jgi:hypothetical protein
LLGYSLVEVIYYRPIGGKKYPRATVEAIINFDGVVVFQCSVLKEACLQGSTTGQCRNVDHLRGPCYLRVVGAGYLEKIALYVCSLRSCSTVGKAPCRSAIIYIHSVGQASKIFYPGIGWAGDVGIKAFTYVIAGSIYVGQTEVTCLDLEIEMVSARVGWKVIYGSGIDPLLRTWHGIWLLCTGRKSGWNVCYRTQGHGNVFGRCEGHPICAYNADSNRSGERSCSRSTVPEEFQGNGVARSSIVVIIERTTYDVC